MVAEAEQMCREALKRDPQDLSVGSLLVQALYHQGKHLDAICLARTMIELGALDRGIEYPAFMALSSGYFKVARKLFSIFPVYDYLYGTMERVIDQLPRAVGHKPRDLAIPIVCWGDAYFHDLLRFGLPSLLAAGNLPSARQAGPITIVIITNKAGSETVRSSEILPELTKFVEFEFFILPDQIFTIPDKYLLFCALSAIAFARSLVTGA